MRFREFLKEYAGTAKAAGVFDDNGAEFNITQNDMGDMPEQLHRLYQWNAKINHLWKVFEFDKTRSRAESRPALLALISAATKTCKEYKTSLNIHEKNFFKKLAKEAALQDSDVNAHHGHDHIARLNFKKDIGI